jgi:hypothetical protein
VVHEVGHQAAALLDLASSLRPALQEEGRRATPGERAAWELWSRWISEIVADVWSVGKLGVCSTLGLIGVVSLPAWAVFRIAVDDPHPVPWIRVRLSAAVGAALYPSPQWATLTAIWLAMYPSEGRPAAERATLAALEATLPRLAALLVDHRPPALGGRSLREVMPIEARRPPRLLAAWRSWEGSLREAAAAPPALALAVLGQARAAGLVTPEAEARMVGRLLTWWALRGTLEAARAAAAPAPALRAPPPVAAPAPVPSVAGRSTR